MPTEIRVGPPVITINDGTTFMVTHLNGDVDTRSELGAFADDTRFISAYHVWLNQRSWALLSSSPLTHYASRWVYTNSALRVEDGELPAGKIGLTLERAVASGLHDDLDVINYDQRPWRFFLELEIKSDFADIFEVKRHRLTERGEKVTEWHRPRKELRTSYEYRDFRRALRIRVERDSTPPQYANGQLSFHIELPPGGSWHACLLVAFEGTAANNPERRCYTGTREVRSLHGRDQLAWHEVATGCSSSNKLVERAFQQSIQDVGALRMLDKELPKDTWLPAAGLPWFMTLFGRDSLIVSFQNMLVHPLFARAALHKLGEMQAQVVDDDRDAQPGKILHEIRYGELATLKLIPHTPYYGTHDATPLYVIVLAEAFRWIGDLQLVRDYLPIAERCLEWIDRYGDMDGDGFQEYKTRSRRGYHNQGWKDAHDAVIYPDGSQVDTPIAVCELQGYVYDAKLRMAELYERLGEHVRAATLRTAARELKRRFNEAFWMPDEDFFAYGLDPRKQQIRSIVSNPGHCLWSGIVDAEKAAAVVRRLLEPDMWSGWGIRTLSTRNPAFNPFSYQLGSVWPHDNAIIAAGFRRYGFAREAAKVARGIFDAAGYFVSSRLPELFAGLPRDPGSFPVQYLGASIPQAWAAGSVFMLVRALLGLEADAVGGVVYADPWLPEWLPDLDLLKVRLGDARFDLRVEGREDASRVEIRQRRGEVELLREQRYLAHAG